LAIAGLLRAADAPAPAADPAACRHDAPAVARTGWYADAGPVTDGPYGAAADTARRRGDPLFPAGSPYVNAKRVAEAETYHFWEPTDLGTS